MTELAEIIKFCAVEGVLCAREVPYRGTNSYFFAYQGEITGTISPNS